MGLHRQGKTNWDLIRSVEGLKGGLGYSGKLCGALSGGVCLLSLYAGRGPEEEEPNPELDPMILEIVEWFEETIGTQYGGIQCDQITSACLDNEELSLTCIPIVIKTYDKAEEILKSRGIDMSKGRE
jgi:C_GCAxxG_C_C family probable redox protein